MRKKTTGEFISEATIKHKGFYDYSKAIYKGALVKINIICPIHGEFLQLPSAHLNGHNCPKCKGKNKTTEEFITQANLIHNNKFDYSKVSYQSKNKKVIIICPTHGEFLQTPSGHLSGRGCLKCANAQKYSNTKDFILKANLIHKNLYDYSKVNYIHSEEKVEIICKKHGSFFQTPNCHLNGHKCPYCKSLTTNEFINLACLVHNNFYDYSLTEFKGFQHKIKIICPIHGEFNQLSINHLKGSGCPKCALCKHISNGEREVVEYIKSIYSGLILESNRNILNGKELDIYLPDLNLAIEYNGIYWHKKKEIEYPGYHKEKAKLYKEKGIKLINISDKSWDKNSNKVKEKLSKIIC